MFHVDGTVDIEIAFLATKMNAEQSGMAIWLIFNSINQLKPMNFNNIYVQSCNYPDTLRFYHKLGKYYTFIYTINELLFKAIKFNEF